MPLPLLDQEQQGEMGRAMVTGADRREQGPRSMGEGEVFQRRRLGCRSVEAATESGEIGTRSSGKGFLAEAEEVLVPMSTPSPLKLIQLSHSRLLPFLPISKLT